MNAKPTKKRFYGLLGVLIVCIVIMRLFDAPLKNDVCTGGIVSFELAKDMHKSQAIIASWNNQAVQSAWWGLIFDFLFLVVYSSFIAVWIGRVRANYSRSSLGYRVGKILGVLIFVAALMDVTENLALLRILGGNEHQIWASVAFFCASIKFGLIGLSLLYILLSGAYLFLRKRRTAI